MRTIAHFSRSIPCWECLKPAAQAIDGHPYCQACIDAGMPQRTRYAPAQEDKRGRAGDAGTWQSEGQ